MNNKYSKVYIITINVNGAKYTIECVRSILKNNYKNYHLIIIENSSTNVDLSIIRRFLDSVSITFDIIDRSEVQYNKNKDNSTLVTIIRNKNISGFSENNNIGIKYAKIKNDFDFIWLLNNDTAILRNTLSEMIKYYFENKNMIIGSVLLYYDRPSIIQAVGGGYNYSYLGGIKTYMKGKNRNEIYAIDQKKINSKINMISGASLLIHKNILGKIGCMDERYFLYGEDLDLSSKAKLNGFRLGVATKSNVLHRHNTLTKKKSSEFYYYHNARSYIIYLKKYENYLVQIIGIVMLMLNSIRKTPKITTVKAVIRGFKDGHKVN